MDRNLGRCYPSRNGIIVAKIIGNNCENQNFVHIPPLPSDSNCNSLIQSYSVNLEGDSHEDCDLSDVVLKYISEMLMEEDIEERACMFQESAALQAAEKSFYEVIGEKYPPLPDHQPMPNIDRNTKALMKNVLEIAAIIMVVNWGPHLSEYDASYIESFSVDLASQSTSQPSYSLSSSTGTVDSLESLVGEEF